MRPWSHSSTSLIDVAAREMEWAVFDHHTSIPGGTGPICPALPTHSSSLLLGVNFSVEDLLVMGIFLSSMISSISSRALTGQFIIMLLSTWNGMPCFCLLFTSIHICFVGMCATWTSPWVILWVIKKIFALMCYVLLLLDIMPFISKRIMLLL